jgi:hypothetical protein
MPFSGAFFSGAFFSGTFFTFSMQAHTIGCLRQCMRCSAIRNSTWDAMYNTKKAVSPGYSETINPVSTDDILKRQLKTPLKTRH